MRKPLSLLLIILLFLSLLAGCNEEEEPSEVTTEPTTQTAGTTVPAEETASETEATAVETEESTAPVEGTEIAEGSRLNTVVLRSGDAELRAGYLALAVDSQGPFLSDGVALNEQGADALMKWLMTKEAQAILEAFGTEAYGKPILLLPEAVTLYTGWIAPATGENKTIHLAVTDIIASSGLLDTLLPVFEEAYGYTVEVQSASAAGVISTAKMALFDLVLTENTEAAQAFISEGYVRTVNGLDTDQAELFHCEYLLCGPKEDPAGAADCETIYDAFSAIAKGEYTFLSRGDGSDLHKLEQSFWPAGQEFGRWYIAADTEMGPLLVMNEMEGGYILTDQLTWLQYSQAEGII